MVDQGFRYAVPAALADALSVGSLVRVPLGGRRVRGYVVKLSEGSDTSTLRPIASLSGRAPVFDHRLLDTLRWAAHHYVSPLSSMLGRAAPPNNPQPAPGRSSPPPDAVGEALPALTDGILTGRRVRPRVILSSHPPVDLIIGLSSRLLAAGRSTMVVVATTREAEVLFERVSAAVPGHAVIAHGDMPDRSINGAWSRATTPCVLVGTPRVAAWPVAAMGAAIIVEEGRRAMKDRQTPTVHARDLLRRRAQNERFGLVVTGPTPTTEMLALGPEMVRAAPGRLWPLVEVVDQREHSTRGAVLTEPTRRALASVTKRNGRSFVFGHRRGYAAATRCVACRLIRKCLSCGSRPDPGEACSRCGAPLGSCADCHGARFEALGSGVGRIVAEVGRIVGADLVRPAPETAPVVVGTERDLIGLVDLDLAVIPDLDGLLFGTNFRAAEDALRLAARLAGAVARGSGRRMIVQTSEPSHPVVRSLVRADPMLALSAELEARRAMGYPPTGELLVIEATGETPPDLAPLHDVCDVLGPAHRNGADRWLVQSSDLGPAKSMLRPMVQRWRDSGLRVRIDVDPIDL